jgi:hypothetical protein
MFANVDRQELKEMEKDERELAKATHFIDDEKHDKSKWALDFLGVAEAYFASYFPQIYDYTEEKLDLVCKVLENFYNYLVLHDVCGEEDIRQDISATRDLVKNKVKPELMTIKELQRHLPGAFNKAVNVLFNKNDMLIVDDTEKFHAEVLIVEAFRSSGNSELAEFFLAPNWVDKVTILKKFNKSLQVISVKRSQSSPGSTSPSTQKPPLGVLTCKPWKNVKLEVDDLPKGLKLDHVLPKTIDFWFEESVLEHCYPGMKLVAELRLLDFGSKAQLWTIGGEITPLCSFYRYILNDLDVKPAQTVDPDVETDGAGAEQNGEGVNENQDAAAGNISDEELYKDDGTQWEPQNLGRVIREDD